MNNRVQVAKLDEFKRETFIRDMQDRILNFASRVSGRRITTSDDEWSIALCAFNSSIDSYVAGKGDYLSYARKRIKHALDEYRTSEKQRSAIEIPFDPDNLVGDRNLVLEMVSRETELEEVRTAEEEGVRAEIAELGEILKDYGFSFFDMAGHTPRGSSRQDCSKVISYLKSNRTVLSAVVDEGKLPVGMLSSKTGVSIGTINKYDKYILMAAVVAGGQFPTIAGYIR
jgi:RNA polymerase sigma factor